MIRNLIRNPLALWASWLIKTWLITIKNKGKFLEIRLMARSINSKFGNNNVLNPHCSVIHCTLGDYVYVGPSTEIHNCQIGSYTSIGPRSLIGLGSHPVNYMSTCPVFYSTNRQCMVTFADKKYYNEVGSNKIGNDVWIGANVIVTDNVSIGDGAIVAAGSVVTKDVAPYTIVGGVPAKPIRKRFSDNVIDELLKLQWWNKDLSWIKQHLHQFQKPINEDHLPSFRQ